MHAEFRHTLDSEWAPLDPVRLGRVPPGLGTADRFVIASKGTSSRVRVDLYADNEVFFHEEVRWWSNLLAIGWGHWLHLVSPSLGVVSSTDLASYFGSMREVGDVLLVASAQKLFCFGGDGDLRWRSPEIALDGVILDAVNGDVVRGQGEWDPPGGWRPFAVRLSSGEVL